MRILLININFLYRMAECHFQKTSTCFSPGDFKEVATRARQKDVISNTTETQEEEVDGDTNNHKFQCPKESYTRGFQRYSSLEKHIAFGKCTNVVERETLLDRAELKYAVILQGG